jgi:hypothetical protein
MIDVIERPKTKLTPEMFTAQLFVSLWDDMDEVSTREPFKTGQRIIPLKGTRHSCPRVGNVFDKEVGGEPLRSFGLCHCGWSDLHCISPGQKLILIVTDVPGLPSFVQKIVP